MDNALRRKQKLCKVRVVLAVITPVPIVITAERELLATLVGKLAMACLLLAGFQPFTASPQAPLPKSLLPSWRGLMG